MDRLILKTVNREVSLEISEDKRKVAIFYQIADEDSDKIAEFHIEDLWDMLKDSLSIIDISSENPGLYRRKQEAIKAKNYLLNGENQ